MKDSKINGLRHTLLHLLFGLLFYFVFVQITHDYSLQYFFWILIGSYLIDLDHIAHHYVYCREHYTAIQFRRTKKEKGLVKAIHESGLSHKDRDRLLFHNMYFFCVMALVFFVSAVLQLLILTAATGAIVMHMLFDIIDDLAVLGHLDHWVWKKKKRVF